MMPETVTLFLCQHCHKPILKPLDGFLVQGNIYVADAENPGGLIGDNFRNGNVERVAYCKPCFCEILGIPLSSVRESPKFKPSGPDFPA